MILVKKSKRKSFFFLESKPDDPDAVKQVLKDYNISEFTLFMIISKFSLDI